MTRGEYADPGYSDQPRRSRLARYATQHAARRQRSVWSARVGTWDQHGAAELTGVTAAVLDAVGACPGAQVVDLGSGTGQISLPLARRGAQVLAVDVSPAMIRRLQSQARRRGLLSIDALALPIEELALPPGSVDLVVSSYALHHLRDPDKARLVSAAYGWLRPGGRLLVADMMFGRGTTSRDLAIIRSKVAALARKGPGGWWRIVKNSARFLLRVRERPVPIDTWMAMFRHSGFIGVTASTIVAEAGLVTGRRPADKVPLLGFLAWPTRTQAWIAATWRGRSEACAGKDDSVTDWIFQGNPRHHELHVPASRQQWWSTPRYRDRTAAGDRVWLQIVGRDHPGIYYIATITHPTYEHPGQPSGTNLGRWRTDIRFDYRISPPLLRLELLGDPQLGPFRPFRGFQGSTVPVPPDIAAFLWERAAPRLEALDAE